MTVMALAGGSFIFLLVIVVVLGGVIYGFFTTRGSGIDHHPHDGEDGAPGAEGQSETSGKDQGEGSALNQHGTR